MNARTLKSIEYPFIQKTPFGNVKIYRGTNRGGALYTVTYLTEDGRKRLAFTDEGRAHTRAEEIIDDFKKGKTFRTEISGQKAALISSYEEALKEHDATIGDAVRFFLIAKAKEHSKRIQVKDACEEYLKRFDTTQGHGKTVMNVMKTFYREFEMYLDQVEVKDLDTYLRQISECGRTRNNHLRGLRTFFTWAQDFGGYLPEGKLVPHKIAEYDEVSQPIQLFTPREIKLLLDAADDALRPFLALGAFAGIRNQEIRRLTWEDIRVEDKFIEMGSNITKTKRRRLPKMPENLIAWLGTFKGEKTGLVAPSAKIHSLTAKLLKRVNENLPEDKKIIWKFNGLRRSYISYRMAQDWTSAEVAKQCGNSSDVVEVNYKALASPSTAEEWFRVCP